MKKVLAVTGFLLASANAAFATGSITCEDPESKVVVDLRVNHSDTLNIIGHSIAIGDETWPPVDENGIAKTRALGQVLLSIGQAFENDGMLLVDFVSDTDGTVIARLKAFSLEDGNDFVSGGVFMFKDKGAYLVDCSVRG